MSRRSLDTLLDDMLLCTEADFYHRWRCAKVEARAFVEHQTVPAGWQKGTIYARPLGAAPRPDTSTRPADHVAEACYFPPECEVCGMPPLQNSLYCSDAHRKIMEGEPDAREIAANL